MSLRIDEDVSNLVRVAELFDIEAHPISHHIAEQLRSLNNLSGSSSQLLHMPGNQ
jgi:hypothetical protein